MEILAEISGRGRKNEKLRENSDVFKNNINNE